MSITDIENNYDYDNEGINDLGFVTFRLTYIKYATIILIVNTCIVYILILNQFS